MAGQIIKRGDSTWLVRVPIGKDPITGKRDYHNKTIHGKKKDAEAYKNRILTEVSTGTYLKASDMLFSAYLDKWLVTVMEPSIGKNTYANHVYYVKMYIKPTLGGMRICEISSFHIQSLYASLSPRLSPMTIRYVHRILKIAFKQAREWKMINTDPFIGVKLPKAKRKTNEFLTEDQAWTFLDHAKKDYYYLLFFFAIMTGMRPSEYCGLSWDDVDFEAQKITIKRGLIRVSNGLKPEWYFSDLKSEKARRELELSPPAMQMLREEKEGQDKEKAINPNYNPYNLVFLSKQGMPVNMKNVRTCNFKPLLKKADLPSTLRLYDLRHACASLLLAQGYDIKVISERLGHASIEITLNVYTHIMPGKQKQATETLSDFLLSTRSAHTEEEKGKEAAVNNTNKTV